jgi:hypothetical protein
MEAGRTFDVWRLDAATGVAQPMTCFNERFGEAFAAVPGKHWLRGEDGRRLGPTELRWHAPAWAVSPDGQWIAWTYQFRRWVVARLDGGCRHERDAEPFFTGELFWMRDSGRLVVKSRESGSGSVISHVAVIAVDVAGLILTVTTSQPANQALVGPGPDESCLFRAVDPNRWHRPAASVRLTKMSVGGLEAHADSEMIPMPTVGVPEELVSSPSGNRLAWVMQNRTDEVGPKWCELWVTALDGTQPRLLGRQKARVGPPPVPGARPTNDLPRDIAWCPDESGISFRFRQRLWVVPLA